MAATPGSDSRKFLRPRNPINETWLEVSTDSLYPTEYKAHTFFKGGGGRSSLVWPCAEPWGAGVPGGLLVESPDPGVDADGARQCHVDFSLDDS
jgi:hypothetical protein